MKRLLYFLTMLLLAVVATMPMIVFAETSVNENVQAVLVVFGPILGGLAVQFPIVAKILSVMIYARIFVKPIMSMLMKIGEGLPEGGLRGTLRSVSGHWAYALVAYLLDWFASVKLPQKAKK